MPGILPQHSKVNIGHVFIGRDGHLYRRPKQGGRRRLRPLDLLLAGATVRAIEVTSSENTDHAERRPSHR